MTDVSASATTEVIAPISARAARSRDKMLRAATDLIVDGGPRAVTVDAVSEASGVAKSTLYRHWASRDDMLVDVVRCSVPEVAEPELGGSFESVLQNYLANVAMTLADPEWSRIIPALMSLRATMPDLADVVEADRASKMQVLVAVLQIGVAEGSVPAGLDPNDLDKILFGPLVFAAMVGEYERLPALAQTVADRFIASFR